MELFHTGDCTKRRILSFCSILAIEIRPIFHRESKADTHAHCAWVVCVLFGVRSLGRNLNGDGHIRCHAFFCIENPWIEQVKTFNLTKE